MSTPWVVLFQGFEADNEGLREALCTLGNGYFATRGAWPHARADGVHYPGTYLAGGYNRLETEIAGRVIENEDLVNMPNWLPLTFRIPPGDWFDLREVDVLACEQELDLRQGVLFREVRFRDREDRETVMRERRLVHMAEPHLAAMEIRVTPENWSGALEFKTALDGSVTNAGVERYKDLNSRHLDFVSSGELDEETLFLKVQTNQSEIRVSEAARTRAYLEGEVLRARRSLSQEQGVVAHRFVVEAAEGSEVRLEKVLAFHTSRDDASSECGLDAKERISWAGSFEELLETHVQAWDCLWGRFDMAFRRQHAPEDDRTSMILRLNTFHLLQTASMQTMDLDAGIPSRGWHGEAYRGHIFWDELFIFPFINLRIPEITRALLLYRYRRLGEARRAAAEEGYRGAMFPWQSGSSGREESQKVHLNPKSGRWIPDNSRLQRHVSAAIAYNISQYYQVTGDLEFLSFYGAEMFLEIARFWSSKATYNPELDRYEILGVMGPDEYHDGYPDREEPGLDNNAYTNVMAAWVLTEAQEILEMLPREGCRQLREKLGLDDEELTRWDDICQKMRLVFHDDGVISQFEGYADLPEFDWDGYRKKYGDIQRLDRILEAEDDTPNRYKASKQADVLMLFYLFSSEELEKLVREMGYDFDAETIPRNIRYYTQRTSHGSTLSRVVHASVLGRLNREGSWPLFEEALKSDYQDIQGGTTPEGIHLGAMAGSVNIAQQTYTGIEPRGHVLWFNPSLSDELHCLSMCIRYRGHSLDLDIHRDRLRIHARASNASPIKVGIKDGVYELKAGEAREFSL